MHSFQKNATFSHSFAFFSKERNILAFFCVLYKKNAAFFAFFYVLYKRTLRSLRSFTFFIKECGVLCVLFGFISHTKMTNLAKKERKRTQHSFYKVKKELNVLFSIYICIYIYIYIYIYLYIYCIYIYIYLLKKRMRVGHAFFSKECNILAFFCVLFKRTKHSRVLLRSL